MIGSLSGESGSVFAYTSIQLGLLTLIKHGLFSLSENMIEKHLWILSNLVLDKSPETAQRIVLEEGLVEKVLELTQNKDSEIEKEAFFCLAGLTGCNQVAIVLMLLDKKLLTYYTPKLVESSETTINYSKINLILDSLIKILELL